MKKLLFGMAAIMLMASCNGKNGGSENAVDSASVNDSMSATIIEDSVKNSADTVSATQEMPLVKDSSKTSAEIKGDKETKAVAETKDAAETKDDKETAAQKETKERKTSPNAKKIDRLLSKYMECAKMFRSEVKAGAMGEEIYSIERAGAQFDEQLKKLQDEMTPEQKEKYNKAKKMW